ncbi:MAG: methyl-accepting chemotaxis protein, partial [Micromonosporaceae bacterium]|nr:methyl-accepting chemotaxis protein [Micromonosporaceae bacterium]
VTKMALLAAASAGMIILVGVIGAYWMTEISDQSTVLEEHHVVPLAYLDEVHASELKSRLDLHRVAVAPTAAERQERLTGLRETDQELSEATAGFKRTSPLADSAGMQQYEENWAKYLQIRDSQLLPVALKGDSAEFSKLHNELAQPLISKAADGIDQVVANHSALAKTDAATADDHRSSGIWWIVGVVIVSTAGSLAFTMLIARRILEPLQRVSTVIGSVAAGDLTATTEATHNDEIGQMSRALDQAIARTRATIKAVGVSAERVAWVTGQTSTINKDIEERANQTSERSSSVNHTAQEVSENVQTVASATEEMRASIAEIGSNSSQAASVASEAVAMARTTNDTIRRLSTSSAEIDTVVRVITSITEQTNLLALNATIEAARAGATGKGFAVVAGEVKDLAQETAKATTGIVAQIGAIQADTASAVEAIGKIVTIIDQIAQYQATIAAAVEEQNASAGEIGRSLLEASQGSSSIASDMREVSDSALATTGSVSESHKASVDLSTVSSELQQLIGQFRC